MSPSAHADQNNQLRCWLSLPPVVDEAENAVEEAAQAATPHEEVAPASASQFPAFYANQPATSRFAPTYATGTTSMAPAQNVPTYKLQTDVNGNQYFVHI